MAPLVEDFAADDIAISSVTVVFGTQNDTMKIRMIGTWTSLVIFVLVVAAKETLGQLHRISPTMPPCHYPTIAIPPTNDLSFALHRLLKDLLIPTTRLRRAPLWAQPFYLLQLLTHILISITELSFSHPDRHDESRWGFRRTL